MFIINRIFFSKINLPIAFSSHFRASFALGCASIAASTTFESRFLVHTDFDNSDSDDFWDN